MGPNGTAPHHARSSEGPLGLLARNWTTVFTGKLLRLFWKAPMGGGAGRGDEIERRPFRSSGPDRARRRKPACRATKAAVGGLSRVTGLAVFVGRRKAGHHMGPYTWTPPGAPARDARKSCRRGLGGVRALRRERGIIDRYALRIRIFVEDACGEGLIPSKEQSCGRAQCERLPFV